MKKLPQTKTYIIEAFLVASAGCGGWAFIFVPTPVLRAFTDFISLYWVVCLAVWPVHQADDVVYKQCSNAWTPSWHDNKKAALRLTLIHALLSCRGV